MIGTIPRIKETDGLITRLSFRAASEDGGKKKEHPDPQPANRGAKHEDPAPQTVERKKKKVSQLEAAAQEGLDSTDNGTKS